MRHVVEDAVPVVADFLHRPIEALTGNGKPEPEKEIAESPAFSCRWIFRIGNAVEIHRVVVVGPYVAVILLRRIDLAEHRNAVMAGGHESLKIIHRCGEEVEGPRQPAFLHKPQQAPDLGFKLRFVVGGVAVAQEEKIGDEFRVDRPRPGVLDLHGLGSNGGFHRPVRCEADVTARPDLRWRRMRRIPQVGRQRGRDLHGRVARAIPDRNDQST